MQVAIVPLAYLNTREDFDYREEFPEVLQFYPRLNEESLELDANYHLVIRD